MKATARLLREYRSTAASGAAVGLLIVWIIWTFWPDKIVPEQFQRKPRQNLQLGRDLLDGAGAFQLRSLETLDQKAAALLTTSGVLLGFGLLILQQVRTTVAIVALYAGLSLLLLGLLAGSAVLIPRTHKVLVVDEEFLKGGYRKQATEIYLLRTCQLLSDFLDTNARQVAKKGRWLTWQFWLLLAGAVALAASFALKQLGV